MKPDRFVSLFRYDPAKDPTARLRLDYSPEFGNAILSDENTLLEQVDNPDANRVDVLCSMQLTTECVKWLHNSSGELRGRMESEEGISSARAETQRTISQWANETFGEPESDFSIAVRAREEMAELLDVLSMDDSDPKAIEEAADVFIVLMRLFERRGVEFWDAVERKMRTNRGRKWQRTGGGHGQHVEEP